MAIYEYYCPTCKEKFDQRRPMSQAAVAVQCAHGHAAERTISAFAMARGDSAGDMFADSEAGGGSCACGGNCGCASMN